MQQIKKKCVSYIVLCICMCMCMCMSSLAQSTLGSIIGTVTDLSGAAIPGAQVMLTNTGTGSTRDMLTDARGAFNFLALPAGSYSVLMQSQGFAKQRRDGIVLYANQTVTADTRMEVSNLQTTVVVDAEASGIDTQNSHISDVITGATLLKLPDLSRQNGNTGIFRDFYFAPGATDPSANDSAGTPAINGARQGDTMVTMDGMTLMALIGSEGGTAVQPSEEAIQELHSVLADAPAEFWRPAAITVVTKPGTNQTHGSLYESYNGNSLNAKNYFASSVPFTVDNSFAVSMGGPIKRDKLFYFADYEGGRNRSRVVVSSTIPLAAWHSGNFGSVATQLKNPYTGQPFQGNQIPSNLLSPVALNLQAALYPQPNFGSPELLAGNFRDQIPGQNGWTVFDGGDGSLQYNISQADSLYLRNSYRVLPVASFTGALPATGNYIEHRIAASGVMSETHIFSPALLNELRLGYTDSRLRYNMVFNGSNLLTQAGMQGPWSAYPPIENVPSFAITGLSGTSGLLGNVSYADLDYEWNDNLSWSHGKHLLKFGVDEIFDRVPLISTPASIYGNYSFSGVYTGSAYADFLLGLPFQTALSSPPTLGHVGGTLLGLYAQDQFQVNNRLTLNYGLRYEYNGPYHGYGSFNHVYSFDPKNGSEVVSSQSDLSHVSPYFPSSVIPVETAAQAGYPSGSLLASHYLNFYPRVGFAYRLFTNPGTVLRGAYGLYASNQYTSYAVLGMLEGNGPFSGSTTFTNKITNGSALFSFPSPYLASGTIATQNVAAANPNITVPYTQQWNLSLEQSLGNNMLATVAYVGTAVRNLLLGFNQNQPAPSTTAFSTSALTYSNFNSVLLYQNAGIDNYNSLQVSVRKNEGKNLSFDTGLTFSRDLTNTTDGNSFNGATPENRFCLSCEYSNNPMTRRWNYYGQGHYILPIGQGQLLFANANHLLNSVIGGWSIAGDTSITSGLYFSPVLSGPDTANTNTSFSQRPDLVGDPHVAHPSLTNWFNVSAYAIPGCPSSDPLCAHTTRTNVGRFGNLRPATLVGPHYVNVDFSLTKSFKVARGNLSLKVVSNDVFNHPNFGLPNTSITTATAGIITGTSNVANRQTNISARFQF
jgi:hypothetical protein